MLALGFVAAVGCSAPAEGGSKVVSGAGTSGGGAGGKPNLLVAGGGGTTDKGGAGASSGGIGGNVDPVDPCPSGKLSCNGMCVGSDSQAPGCVVLFAPQAFSTIDSLRLGPDFVYWRRSGATYDIMRASKTGGASQVVVNRPNQVDAIAVNSSVVAWLEAGADYQLFTAPSAGGEAKAVFTSPRPPGAYYATFILTDSHIYADRMPAFEKGEVVAMNLDGSGVTVLGSAPDGVTRLAASEQWLFWGLKGAFGDPYTVMQAPLAGGAAQPTQVAQLAPKAILSGLEVAGDWLYLASHDLESTRSLQRMPLAGGALQDVPGASQDGSPIPTAAALYTVYDHRITETSPQNGQTTTLFESPDSLSSVAADESGVYVILHNSIFTTFVMKVK